MKKEISFLTFTYESEKKKISMNYFIKTKSFYNISNFEGDELLITGKTHLLVDGTVLDEQWHVLPLKPETIIKQEIVIMNKQKDRNKKSIRYFKVTKKENFNYYYGIFGMVEEVSFDNKMVNKNGSPSRF